MATLTESNKDILNVIRANASPGYQERIPDATKGNIQRVMRAVMNWTPAKNEFLDALINRIGTEVVRDISWSNPLTEFKRPMMEFGDTIQEIQVGLLKANRYDPDREVMEKTLFGTHKVPVASNFHTVNRQDRYDITINDALLRRAFTAEGGLSNFISALMQAPSTSDNLDEFLLMCSLFAEYESNGGFYHLNVPDVRNIQSGGDEARHVLRVMRATGENMRFPNSQFNAAKFPTFARPEDIVVFATPEFRASIDVEGLAAAFNIERADVPNRIITIPQANFGVDKAQAIMTTKDFFIVADTLLENTSQQNPGQLQTNYFLHHWQILSASRFVPAVMLWDGPSDESPIVITTPTSLSDIVLKDVDGNTIAANGDVQRGQLFEASATVAPEAASDALVWTVSGQQSPSTSISAQGVLHVGWDEKATTITIKAETAFLDPSNVRKDAISKTLAVKPAGTITPAWPATGIAVGAQLLDTRVDFVPGTTAYTLITDETTVPAKNVKVISYGPIESKVTVAGNVVTIVADLGRPGAEVTYTITLTPPTP